MKKILFIYTGGTVGMVKNHRNGALEPMDFDNLISNLPELRHFNAIIDNSSFKRPIDSTDISINEWVEIAQEIEKNYKDYDGFVVLHGSDTMSYSASMLSFMLEGLDKPVIFTGSQLPIGHIRTDAKENIITSIYFASNEKIKEVCVYFEFKLHRGNRTKKISSQNFNAYISPNYPFLAETGVNIKINEKELFKNQKKNLRIRKNISPNVAVLKIFPGISKTYIENVFNTKNLEGVIIESYGSGNIMSYDWLLEILRNAINNKNIKIVNVSQCFSGEVLQGYYSVSSELESIGVIGGKDITFESAITKMMLLLGEKTDNFKHEFLKPISGEISV